MILIRGVGRVNLERHVQETFPHTRAGDAFASHELAAVGLPRRARVTLHSVHLLERFREWRVDRFTDRLARRPYGRLARKTYGADDAHAFLWEPVLDALALEPDDRLLDVGCGGGAFLRHVRATVGCEAAGRSTTAAQWCGSRGRRALS